MGNAFYFGDNLHIMREYLADESVDLIYLDPPFNSNANYNLLFKSPDRTRWSDAQIETFEDTWSWGPMAEAEFKELTMRPGPAGEALVAFHRLLGENDMLAYLTMMAGRIVELHRVLKATGSFYLHCDPTASHYLKILLDAVFSAQNFRSEIVWRRGASHNKISRQYGPIHDILLFYGKSKKAAFRPKTTPHNNAYIEGEFRFRDGRGRYRLNEIMGPGIRKGESGKPWNNYDPTPRGRHWAIPEAVKKFLSPSEMEGNLLDQLTALHEKDLIVLSRSGRPKYKQYPTEGVPYQDIWAYQPGTQGILFEDDQAIDEDVKWLSNEEERLGYPTQKPVGLLERVIQSSSEPGQVVLDPFCGCGTTLHAAQKLGRNWIGIDVAVQAMKVVGDRLANHFPGIDFDVFGIPKSVEGARWLAANDPFKFEEWAVLRVGGMHSGKFRGDAGIDGTFFFLRGQNDENSRGIISVKGGQNLNPGMIRDLAGTLQRERGWNDDPCAIGVFICARKPTEGMLSEARKAGTIETDFGSYPAIQILSVEDIFAGEAIRVPFIHDSITAAQSGRRRGKKQSAYIDPRELARQRQMLFTISGSHHEGSTSAINERQVMPQGLRRAG